MTSPADSPLILRYAAFPTHLSTTHSPATSETGNPAGVVLDAAELSDSEMQRIAAEIGYSETAFVTGADVSMPPGTPTAEPRRSIRYFSPGAEVPFCGHATIATAVALAERTGTGRFTFDTPIGAVVMHTTVEDGQIVAAFTSVNPELRPLDSDARAALLRLLGLAESDLDERFRLLVAYAGNWHPLVFVRDLATFDAMTFNPADARQMMDAEGWAGTISVLHAVAEHDFEARNVFPVGTITEDPATGSAAASLGGYLRETGLLEAPTRIHVHQGRHVGRPSLLTVDIPQTGGIIVSGTAIPIASH